MKHLKIEVNGQEWVNGEFAEISFTDGAAGVRIEAKAGGGGRPAAPATNGGGNAAASLLEMFSNATRARAQAAAPADKAEAPVVEVVEPEAAVGAP